MILPLLAQLSILIDPGKEIGQIGPAMFGGCIEDVNHEIYGGLYAQRIFGESFEEPAPETSPQGWKLLDGEWTPDGSGIHVRGGNGPKLVYQSEKLGDGDFEATIAQTNDLGDNAGLVVRVSDEGVGADRFTGYEISISPKTRQLILGKHVQDFRPLVSVPVPAIPGHVHRLRVRLDGSRVRVYFEDETTARIDFIDKNSPLLVGKVGLRAWRADASFSRVLLQGRKLSTSLAGAGISKFWREAALGDVKSRFALEDKAPNGSLCQRIDFLSGIGTVGVANSGLNRWGISVQKSHPMEGSLALRGSVPNAIIELQSANGRKTYARKVLPVGSAWKRLPFNLAPNTTDPNARMVVLLDRPGSLWIDQVLLMEGRQDRYRGLPVRADIAHQLLKSGVKFLRYGGTMVNVPGYRWKNMVGDPAFRQPYAGHWNSCSTNGFGIFEFLRFCEASKIGSAFAINVDETAQDASDLVDYLTGSAATFWGRRRIADGHPKPYAVEYIEIGNEEGIGNPDGSAMQRYAERFRALSNAIHRRNKGIKLVCGAWWVPESSAMETVFRAIDGVATAWDSHFWCDDLNAGESVGRDLDRAKSLFKTWNPVSNLKVMVFEENGNRHDVQRALGHATTVNATRRRSNFVLADCAANALQPWRQNDNGWDQGGVFFTNRFAWSMPPALVRQMVSGNQQDIQLATPEVAGLDIAASRSTDGRTISVDLVNSSEQAREIRLALKGGSIESANANSVSGPLNGENLPENPNEVSIRPLAAAVTQSEVSMTLPPRSVSSLRLRHRAKS